MIMPIILFALLGLAGVFVVMKQKGSVTPDIAETLTQESARPLASNDYGLPDVLPENQGGVYNRKYDDVFYQVSLLTGVPFALLKAHAIRESSLKPDAYLDEGKGRASYGLMQILWWPSSSRFSKWGVTDDEIGSGSLLYDPTTNVFIAAKIISENLQRFGGSIRDAVNAYNSGGSEALKPAPKNYVNDVLNYYGTITKGVIT